ncbi:SRPBCC family protein [Pseudochelatococcus sp. B33]
MNMNGEQRIAASKEIVWATLNDPLVLKECIPGCQALEGSLDEGLTATVTTKIGPVRATFNGTVSFAEVVAHEGYVITGEGKGGIAGFAKGGARVRLTGVGDETLLSYEVDAQVGGKLAQLGGRLIDTTARKMADLFFACFRQKAEARAAEGADS